MSVDLLERDAETATLALAIDAVVAGAGRLVVFDAPPGVGKTELLRTAGAMCRESGLRVATARGSELEREFAFGVVRQLFDPLLANGREVLLSGAATRSSALFNLSPAPAAGPESQGLFGLLHGLYWLTVNLSDQGPAALIVDDAHWGDSQSLEFLGFLLRRIDTLPVLIVVATRPVGPGPGDRALASLLSDPAAIVAEPRPLSPVAVAQLVRHALGPAADEPFGRACYEVTRGNPLFVRELLRVLAAQGTAPVVASVPAVLAAGPGAVARYVWARVSLLATDLRRLAEAVAVLGDEADLTSAAQLADLPGDVATRAADDLVRLGMLATASPPAFAHPLVREALYQAMPTARRNEAHDRAAQLLARAGATAERVASHVLHTSPQGEQRRVEILLLAARAARDRGVPEGAAVYLARARAEPPAAELRSEVSRELGNCEAYCLQFDDAEQHLREAVQLAPTPQQRALASFSLARFRNACGEPGEAIGILAAAAAELPADANPLLSVRLAGELVGFARLPVTGRAAQLAWLVEFERGLDQGSRLWPPYPDVLAAQQSLEEVGRDGGRAATVRVLAEGALAAGLLRPDQSAVYAAATALLVCGALDSAERHLEAALQQAASRGLALPVAMLHATLARAAFMRGDLAEVEARVTAALAAAAGSHFALPVLRAAQIEAALESGDVPAAAEALAASGLAGTAEIPDSCLWLGLLYARARVKLACDDYPAALADFRECGRRYLIWAPAMLEFPWRSGAGRALLRLGEDGEAERLAAQELALARSFGAPRQLGIALTGAASMAGSAAAIPLAAEAVEVLDASTARLDLAKALEVSGDCLSEAGQRAQARLAFRRALQIALECRANAVTDRIRQRLAAGGGRPPRLWLTGVHALTPTERRVARLAADDMTNRAIAETLFVTEKTVEAHLHSVYRKLDATARWQLAAKLGDDPAGASRVDQVGRG